MKNCEAFSLTSFGTGKYDCVMNTREWFGFLPLTNILVITGCSFLLLIISAITSPTLSRILISSLDCTLQYFCRHHSYDSSINEGF